MSANTFSCMLFVLTVVSGATKVKRRIEKKTPFLTTQKNNRKSQFWTLAVSLLIFSALPMLLFSLQTADADCVSYTSSSNTIRISCNTNFEHIVSHVTNTAVIKNLGGGEWLLNAILQVDDGAKLTISTPSVSWLKIAGSNGIVVYGSIDITGSKITSWSTSAGAPISQINSGSTPRAYINLRASEGGTISGAEIAYLGYSSTGKRGLDLYGTGNSHDLTITGNSKFHDNWMGFYSTGAYNIIIENSEFYNNIKYAIDPHTSTRDMRVSNVHAHDNLGVAIICSYKCSNITFENNVVHDNKDVALFFSRQTTDSIIRNNEVYNQPGQAYPVAISVSESQNNQIYGNKIKDSLYGVTVHNPSPPDEDGISTGNVIRDNSFDNVQYAFRASASAKNTFASNSFEKITNDHYLITSGASITIEHQQFSNTKVHGTSGNNEVIIQQSGRINIGGTVYDTDATPYKKILNSQTIVVNSVTSSEPTPPPTTSDTTRPTVKITSPATGSSIAAGAVHIEGTASDNEGGSGIKTVQVRVHKWINGILGDLVINYQTATPASSGDWSSWSTDLNIVNPGQYRIQARATDNAGNQNWHSIYVTVQ